MSINNFVVSDLGGFEEPGRRYGTKLVVGREKTTKAWKSLA